MTVYEYINAFGRMVWERATGIFEKPFLVCIICVFASLLFVPAFSTNDDYIIAYQMLISESHFHVFYIHPWIAYLLKGISSCFPFLPVLFLFNWGVSFLAQYAVLLSLRRFFDGRAPTADNAVAYGLAVCMIVFLSVVNYIQPQFTQTAGFCMVSGICFYFVAATRLDAAISVALFVLGCFIRVETFYLAIPFLFLMLILQGFFKITGKKSGKSWLLFALSAAAGILAMLAGERLAFHGSPELAEAKQFNIHRNIYIDYPDTSGRDKLELVRKETGLTPLELGMVKGFGYHPDLMDNPALSEKLAHIQRQGETVLTKISAMEPSSFYTFRQSLLPVVLTALLGIFCFRIKPWSFVLPLVYLFSLLLLFVYLGRIYERVLFGPSVLAVVFLFFSFRERKISLRLFRLAALSCVLVLAVSFVVKQGPIMGGHIKRLLTGETHRTKLLYDYLSARPQSVFMLANFATPLWNPAFFVTQDHIHALSHVYFLKGWHVHNPSTRQAVYQLTHEDLYLYLARHDSAYAVYDSRVPGPGPDLIVRYLKERYHLACSYTVVDETGGFLIVRFYPLDLPERAEHQSIE